METVTCNLCGCEGTKIIHQMPDWVFGKQDILFTFVECTNCGLVYQNPRPTSDEMAQYYPENYDCYPVDIFSEEKTKGLMRRVILYGMTRRFSSVRKYKHKGRLLDIGCATGAFLESILYIQGSQKGGKWELFGVEISPYAAEIARKKGLNIVTGTLKDANFSRDSFDAITLWDVFEHLHDPTADLEELYRVLKTDGILVMRVPNIDCWDAKLFGKYWVGYEPPRHLYIFGRETIVHILERNGFKVKHLETRSSRYLTFVLSLRFAMVGNKIFSKYRERIIRLLNHPIARLVFAPLFFVYGIGLRGPLITIVAEKKLREEERNVRDLA